MLLFKSDIPWTEKNSQQINKKKQNTEQLHMYFITYMITFFHDRP